MVWRVGGWTGGWIRGMVDEWVTIGMDGEL